MYIINDMLLSYNRRSLCKSYANIDMQKLITNT